MSRESGIINAPTTYYGQNIFITSQWFMNSSYATVGMLQEYANLNYTNIFIQPQVFSNVISTVINGVQESVFPFLANITTDVMTELNKLVNVFYFSSNSTTYVKDNLISDYLGSVNDIESQVVNTNSLNCQMINTASLQTNSINVNNIVSQNTISSNDIGVYLFLNGFQMMPIMKSQTNLNITSSTTIYCHIRPNYYVICKNSFGALVMAMNNNTNDIMYNVNIGQNLSTIELYLNGRKI